MDRLLSNSDTVAEVYALPDAVLLNTSIT